MEHVHTYLEELEAATGRGPALVLPGSEDSWYDRAFEHEWLAIWGLLGARADAMTVGRTLKLWRTLASLVGSDRAPRVLSVTLELIPLEELIGKQFLWASHAPFETPIGSCSEGLLAFGSWLETASELERVHFAARNARDAVSFGEFPVPRRHRSIGFEELVSRIQALPAETRSKLEYPSRASIAEVVVSALRATR